MEGSAASRLDGIHDSDGSSEDCRGCRDLEGPIKPHHKIPYNYTPLCGRIHTRSGSGSREASTKPLSERTRPNFPGAGSLAGKTNPTRKTPATTTATTPPATVISAAATAPSTASDSSQAAATALKPTAVSVLLPPVIQASLAAQTADFKTQLQFINTSLTKFLSASQPLMPIPRTLIGTILQPAPSGGSGSSQPGAFLQVDVMLPAGSQTGGGGGGSGSSGATLLASGLTGADGTFEVNTPGGVLVPVGGSIGFAIRGSGPAGSTTLDVAASDISDLGYVGTLTLDESIPPIPANIYGMLQQVVGSMYPGPTPTAVAPGSTPPITLGGDTGDCVRVLENASSIDEFPYGIFFRFTDPQVVTEVPSEQTIDQIATSRGYLPENTTDTAAQRSAVTQPISIDVFRRSLVNGTVLAGSISIGYILRVAQRWTFQGLALGDLTYSLPLAPGEQQQVVVIENSAQIAVQEAEAVAGTSYDASSQQGDSSTNATFNSALNQAASGGSRVSTDSTTTGFTAGGGLLGILGGPSTSIGSTQTSGNQTSWMSGLQDYASDASQAVQTSAQQQGASRRTASRTSMRLASASESTSVTTKTITNHNKTRALTMEYFEVLRLYDITTVYEAVDMVCMVPLDIIWWLPAGQQARLPGILASQDIAGAQAAQSASEIGSSLQNQLSTLQTILNTSAFAGAGGLLGGGAGSGGSGITAGAQAVAGNLSALSVQASQLSSALGQLESSDTANISSDQVSSGVNLAIQVGQALSAVNALASDPTGAGKSTAAINALNTAYQTAKALQDSLTSSATAGGLSRDQIIARYQAIIDHQDVLTDALPEQYISALTRLEQFAADPRSTVALDSLAEDVIQFTANATVFPFDHVYVAAVTRWGGRVGPVEMMPKPPVTIPGQSNPSESGALQNAQDLINWLTNQRLQGVGSAGGAGAPTTLEGYLPLPNSLSPSDVIGFEITHEYDPFTYQFAAPSDSFLSELGTNPSTWPSWLGAGLLGLIQSPPLPPPPVQWTPQQTAQNSGSPYFWNFQAILQSGVGGGGANEVYSNGELSAVELPSGIMPIPAQQVSPVLKYSDLIAIEAVLQHVLRNVVRYSRDVWKSLTAEERIMLLEPYTVPGPTGNTMIPLVDCIGNEVLGFFGNSMIMPFNIPPPLEDGTNGWGVSTSALENNLLLLHNLSPPTNTSRIALPTQGVLGEAMLGHCPSAEKIDLTRFWNWQDSPGDTAPSIAPVSATPTALQTLAGVQAPNALTGMVGTLTQAPNPPTPPAVGALAQTLAQGAPPASIPNLSGLQQLVSLASGTQTAASQAQQAALNAQTSITSAAINQAGSILQSMLGGQKSSGTTKPGGGSSGSSAASSLIPIVLAAMS